jgi:outer membrane lipoprotein carrier protein
MSEHMIKRLSALLAIVGSVSLLLASAVGAANVTDGKQRAEQFLEGLEGLQAQFKQTLSDRTGEVTDESSGTLAIKRPNRFRWDYHAPYEQVIVSDGTRVWVYDSDLEQVTVRKLDVALSSTPAMLLSGDGALTDNFNVTEATERGGVLWVRMEPKRNDTDFKSVQLGFASASGKSQDLKFMELADKLGQTTLLEFSKLERNPVLDASRFEFKVPPGADVIGDAGTASDLRNDSKVR